MDAMLPCLPRKRKSLFKHLKLAEISESDHSKLVYDEDYADEKVYLTTDEFRTDDGLPWVLPVVRSIEMQMAEDLTMNHEYLPTIGLDDFRLSAVKLLVGDGSKAIVENRVDGVQTLGSIGALHVGLEFLKDQLDLHSTVCIPNPSPELHKMVVSASPYFEVREYRYWNEMSLDFDICGMLEDIQRIPDRSVVLLQMCAHNPTGMDPTEEQWALIADLIREKFLFPFFDCTYQGLSSGNFDVDASALRYFVNRGFELFAAQSFSHTMGICNERVGQLVFVTSRSEILPKVRSQLTALVRQTWFAPPGHGSRIAATILNNPALFTEWKENIQQMATRICATRQRLYFRLKTMGTPGDWRHLIRQTGMHCYIGLNAEQCSYLQNRYHLHLPRTGQINICAINNSNFEYVAMAIHNMVLATINSNEATTF